MKRSAGSIFREESPCAYFQDGRNAVLEYLFADERSMAMYHLFLARGYRRWGSVFYRNDCRCADCIPLRIETAKFHPSKSQRRTLRKNHDIRVEVVQSDLSDEKLALYKKYLSVKHDRSEEEERIYETLLAIHYGYPLVREMDYFVGDRLIAVGVVDEAADALSSNYFYYDTDYVDRRPGVFSILHEIALARAMRKRYLYLGYYIGGTPKMAYKKQFRPSQIYEQGAWQDFMS